jgi:hypothetical protein
MPNRRRSGLARWFWLSVVATLVWLAVPQGIYHLVAGSQKWGFFLLILGLAIASMVAIPGVLSRLENRPIVGPLGMLLVGTLVLFALLLLWTTATARPGIGGADTFAIAQGVGFLALAALTSILYVRLAREAQLPGPPGEGSKR